MKATIAWILALLLPVAAAAVPAVGTPVVYHSPNNNGVRSSISPYPITAANDRPLYLYIAYDNTTPDNSTTGTTMCVDKNGDETCAFDFSLALTDGIGGTATFDTFTPAVTTGTIVGQIDPATHRSLRVNGINVNGMPIPARIGTLTVDAAGAKPGFQIRVVGVHRVGAAGQLDAIQPVAIVPEPSRVTLLGSGIAALLALHRLRRRRSLHRGAT